MSLAMSVIVRIIDVEEAVIFGVTASTETQAMN